MRKIIILGYQKICKNRSRYDNLLNLELTSCIPVCASVAINQDAYDTVYLF